MRPEYQVQRLDGYTDGKPSWCKYKCWPTPWTREDALVAIAALLEKEPNAKFRVRKVRR